MKVISVLIFSGIILNTLGIPVRSIYSRRDGHVIHYHKTGLRSHRKHIHTPSTIEQSGSYNTDGIYEVPSNRHYNGNTAAMTINVQTSMEKIKLKRNANVGHIARNNLGRRHRESNFRTNKHLLTSIDQPIENFIRGTAKPKYNDEKAIKQEVVIIPGSHSSYLHKSEYRKGLHPAKRISGSNTKHFVVDIVTQPTYFKRKQFLSHSAHMNHDMVTPPAVKYDDLSILDNLKSKSTTITPLLNKESSQIDIPNHYHGRGNAHNTHSHEHAALPESETNVVNLFRSHHGHNKNLDQIMRIETLIKTLHSHKSHSELTTPSNKSPKTTNHTLSLKHETQKPNKGNVREAGRQSLQNINREVATRSLEFSKHPVYSQYSERDKRGISEIDTFNSNANVQTTVPNTFIEHILTVKVWNSSDKLSNRREYANPSVTNSETTPKVVETQVKKVTNVNTFESTTASTNARASATEPNLKYNTNVPKNPAVPNLTGKEIKIAQSELVHLRGIHIMLSHEKQRKNSSIPTLHLSVSNGMNQLHGGSSDKTNIKYSTQQESHNTKKGKNHSPQASDARHVTDKIVGSAVIRDGHLYLVVYPLGENKKLKLHFPNKKQAHEVKRKPLASNFMKTNKEHHHNKPVPGNRLHSKHVDHHESSSHSAVHHMHDHPISTTDSTPLANQSTETPFSTTLMDHNHGNHGGHDSHVASTKSHHGRHAANERMHPDTSHINIKSNKNEINIFNHDTRLFSPWQNLNLSTIFPKPESKNEKKHTNDDDTDVNIVPFVAKANDPFDKIKQIIATLANKTRVNETKKATASNTETAFNFELKFEGSLIQNTIDTKSQPSKSPHSLDNTSGEKTMGNSNITTTDTIVNHMTTTDTFERIPENDHTTTFVLTLKEPREKVKSTNTATSQQRTTHIDVHNKSLIPAEKSTTHIISEHGYTTTQSINDLSSTPLTKYIDKLDTNNITGPNQNETATHILTDYNILNSSITTEFSPTPLHVSANKASDFKLTKAPLLSSNESSTTGIHIPTSTLAQSSGTHSSSFSNNELTTSPFNITTRDQKTEKATHPEHLDYLLHLSENIQSVTNQSPIINSESQFKKSIATTLPPLSTIQATLAPLSTTQTFEQTTIASKESRVPGRKEDVSTTSTLQSHHTDLPIESNILEQHTVSSNTHLNTENVKDHNVSMNGTDSTKNNSYSTGAPNTFTLPITNAVLTQPTRPVTNNEVATSHIEKTGHDVNIDLKKNTAQQNINKTYAGPNKDRFKSEITQAIKAMQSSGIDTSRLELNKKKKAVQNLNRGQSEPIISLADILNDIKKVQLQNMQTFNIHGNNFNSMFLREAEQKPNLRTPIVTESVFNDAFSTNGQGNYQESGHLPTPSLRNNQQTFNTPQRWPQNNAYQQNSLSNAIDAMLVLSIDDIMADQTTLHGAIVLSQARDAASSNNNN